MVAIYIYNEHSVFRASVCVEAFISTDICLTKIGIGTC